MRHLRAFLYFFVGVLIALNASFVFSASPFKMVPGGYYQYGNSVTRKYSDFNDSKKLTNVMQNVYKADSQSVGITTQVAIDYSAQMMKARVTDSYKVPINPIVDAAKKAAMGGLSGLRGGVPGVIGAAAGALLMDALIQEGLEWSAEAEAWNKLVQMGTPTRCNTTSTPPACADYAYFVPFTGYYFSKYGAAKMLSIPTASEQLALANAGWLPASYGPYTSATCGIEGTYTVCIVTGKSAYVNKFSNYNPTKPHFSEPKTAFPASDSELTDAIKRAIDAQLAPFISAMQSDNTPIEYDPSIQATTVGDQAISQPKTSTSTQVNPDGSRVIENKTSSFTVTPVGTGTIGGDIGLEIEELVQTTTNTCAADGTCDVTEKTETTTDSPVVECPPDSTDLKCVGLGDPPDLDIPTSKKNVSLTPYTFNMTAACPAPVQFVVRDQTYFVSYQPICDFAGFIKALVLISAVVTAYFICFGTRREGN